MLGVLGNIRDMIRHIWDIREYAGILRIFGNVRDILDIKEYQGY